MSERLPVAPRVTRADEVKAYSKASHLWTLIKKIMIVNLKSNVCVGQFSELLIKLGMENMWSQEEGCWFQKIWAQKYQHWTILYTVFILELLILYKVVIWTCYSDPWHAMAAGINHIFLEAFEGEEWRTSSTQIQYSNRGRSSLSCRISEYPSESFWLSGS